MLQLVLRLSHPALFYIEIKIMLLLIKSIKMSSVIAKPSQIKPEMISRILNTDKLLINNMTDLCFRRCIVSYEKEYLNPLEQNCVDRCVSKYD